jgi:2,3-bisphosphoglycerate-independent phosphoglycerate mutase
MLPYPLHLLSKLSIATDSRILLVVLDGVGDVPIDGETPLSAAATPHLDALAAGASLGLSTPVAPGITPGSGPGHLSLFGYDPLVYDVGRGVLSALGIGLELGPNQIAARGNFASLGDDGKIVDRRAGRIATAINESLIALLSREIDVIDDVRVDLYTESEYRFVVRLTGADLSGDVSETDPGRVGEEPLEPRSLDGGAESTRTAAVLAGLARRIGEVLSESEDARESAPPVNGVLLRGIGAKPALPQLPEICRLRPASVAAYPMYRGVSRLVGMQCLTMDLQGSGERTVAKLEAYRERAAEHDFVYYHVKKTDSFGEDGNFEKKKEQIEVFDHVLPGLLASQPDVVVITGDHSTPVPMKAHSWHPLPVLISGALARPDGRRYTEANCRSGSLGTLRHVDLLPLAMAHAGKLAKYGA